MSTPHHLLDDKVSFQTLCPELDKRILKAIAKLSYVYPTLVQVREQRLHDTQRRGLRRPVLRPGLGFNMLAVPPPRGRFELAAHEY